MSPVRTWSPALLIFSLYLCYPNNYCESSSVGRASAFQAECRQFEPGLSLFFYNCRCSSGVERFLGKEEVSSSNLDIGSSFYLYLILISSTNIHPFPLYVLPICQLGTSPILFATIFI